jgi:hypothetical protein
VTLASTSSISPRAIREEITLFAAPPLRLFGSGRTRRSGRLQAAERMTSWASVSLDMEVLLSLAAPATIAGLLPPEAPLRRLGGVEIGSTSVDHTHALSRNDCKRISTGSSMSRSPPSEPAKSTPDLMALMSGLGLRIESRPVTSLIPYAVRQYPMGRKEARELAAKTAAVGTEWEDLLERHAALTEKYQ